MTANEKVRPALPCQADRNENLFNVSIPQSTLAITMEPINRDPIGIDSFKGSIRSFRSYLKAKRILLAVGIIA